MNRRPTRYYLVEGRLEDSTLYQKIVAVFVNEEEAFKTAEKMPKAIITDCRDWCLEELDNGSRAIAIQL
ncbi:hypothetical protein UH38_24175 [Aliterella atlantica CENA595]|uniref:Uncharacterized protein n=2 Tax=Aliterella TaxID=1827277 RepID=A0A0D8ZKN6_9CYAN|nr:hypothetical protein UH38_24175 [Aliterella atlantica CENA595]